MAKKQKIVVAMSGGVDSSVTAALLVEQGYDVEGASLRLWDCNRLDAQNCSDHMGAKSIADVLGIPHTLMDARVDFVNGVVKPFIRSYLEGRTPNPCVACNRDFKLGVLLDWAKARGADYVATGHYARIARDAETGRFSLFRGIDRNKDQSYFLFALSQEQLANTLFPLGGLEKIEVRAVARRLGLSVAERPESQDVCFGDYRSFVERFADPAELQGGDIVDRAGNILGRHNGLHRLTIGQRKGLGLSSPQPLYVLEIDEASRRVVVGGRNELNCTGLIAASINWVEAPVDSEFAAEVQVRYRSSAIPCRVRLLAGGSCEARFETAFPAVTPGQAAVFFRGDRVLGGGWIDQAIHREAVVDQPTL
ncbi:MAG TPA: tRNA 2-thiouridine(34) synthase MnmA [Verrucomicrobiae bacterium]|jgi:tRNA-specific 2-thiouridylase|nr:tRNA 2-thiouridine(34) synthase MnmA [Verrucomicrobiae bacterium]